MFVLLCVISLFTLQSLKYNVNENGCSHRPNCTPTACEVWVYCIRKPGMRVRGDKFLLTLIPGYHISPLMGRVRPALETLMIKFAKPMWENCRF